MKNNQSTLKISLTLIVLKILIEFYDKPFPVR